MDRRLRIGFFAIKPIAVGEEIVFDYQFDRYGLELLLGEKFSVFQFFENFDLRSVFCSD